MAWVYYNECDPQAAEWLRCLIDDSLIPNGVVDERPIQKVETRELEGYDQHHFFAGVGGWPLALRLAGWPDDRPVWTGSCPCQPFSAAGKRKAQADDRHLWPAFFRLIRECRPECVFGEQVEGAIRHGWLDGVCADLEGEVYAVGSCVLGAHSVGAPHIRQRLYWVAHAGHAAGCAQPRVELPERGGRSGQSGSDARGVEHPAGDGRGERRAESGGRGAAGGRGDGCGVGDPGVPRREGEAGGGAQRREPADSGRNHWRDSVLIDCRDGKRRRVPAEPGLFPLAHGLPGRVGLLRGAGNAIVPQVAAAFVNSYLETIQE